MSRSNRSKTGMTDVNPFANRNECSLLPMIIFGAINCGECDTDHGYYLSIGFLFWGVEVLWVKEDGE